MNVSEVESSWFDASIVYINQKLIRVMKERDELLEQRKELLKRLKMKEKEQAEVLVRKAEQEGAQIDVVEGEKQNRREETYIRTAFETIEIEFKVLLNELSQIDSSLAKTKKNYEVCI